jgi:hypothetical protein
MAHPPRQREYWEKLVAKFEKTDMTRGAFADEHKVKRRTFYHWLYKLRWEKEAHKKPKAKPGFVEVKLDGSSRTSLSAVRIELPGDVAIVFARMPDPEYLGTVLATLS